MTSDHIYVVSSHHVENDFSGDPVGTVLEYVKEVFGSNYGFHTTRGYDISGNNASSLSELQDWWENQSFTSTDRNLLLVKATTWGEGGHAEYPSDGGHAAVASLYDGMTDMTGPDQDADLIGGQTTTGYAAPAQIATCIHELGHLFGAHHDEGYVDNHNLVNYISPVMGGYADDEAGTTNVCGDKQEYNGLLEDRWVEGYMQCVVDNAKFNHTPKEVYTASEVDSF